MSDEMITVAKSEWDDLHYQVMAMQVGNEYNLGHEHGVASVFQEIDRRGFVIVKPLAVGYEVVEWP